MQPMAQMVGPVMSAMMILGAPAFFIFVGLMILTWRRSKKGGSAQE